MPDVTLIAHDGTAYAFEAACGLSLMQAATGYGVAGIVADCGGSAICATCHVIVDAAWVARLPPPAPAEAATLAITAVARTPGSRLACQIRLEPELQGLIVRLPEYQR